MLTDRQQDTLEFIRQYIHQKQRSPTCSEIAKGIGIISRGVVYRYVKALEKEGYLKIIPGKNRNIRLRHNYKNQIFGLPLLGSLLDNEPLRTVNNVDVYNINNSLLKPNRFLLQIGDNSLRDSGIYEDDFIICELKSEIQDQQVAVVIIKEEMTQLKKFSWNGDGSVTLAEPFTGENPTVYNQNHVKIYGLYKGLFRSYLGE